jgi:hypothetical protein
MMNDAVSTLRLMEVRPLKELMMLIMERASKGRPPLSEVTGQDVSDANVEALNHATGQISIGDSTFDKLVVDFGEIALQVDAGLKKSFALVSHGGRGPTFEEAYLHYIDDGGGKDRYVKLRATYLALSKHLEALVAK